MEVGWKGWSEVEDPCREESGWLLFGCPIQSNLTWTNLKVAVAVAEQSSAGQPTYFQCSL
jgi:hypothetical protein